MNSTKLLAANVALTRNMQKRAAVNVSGLDSADKHLLEQCNHSPNGGSPAAANQKTIQSDAEQFDHNANGTKPSGKGADNTVGDNADTTPRSDRQKEASVLEKAAAAVTPEEGDAHLEAQAKKQITEGPAETGVCASNSEDCDPVVTGSGGGNGADENKDSVPRSKEASDALVKLRASGIKGFIKSHFAGA